MKNTFAIWMLALASVQSAPSQPGAPSPTMPRPAAPRPTTASALLDAWSASQKQRQRFVLQYELVSEGDELYHHPRYARYSGQRKLFSRGEVRCDGDRIFFSNTEWAESANKEIAIPKEYPRQRAWLWDGRVHYFHTPGISAIVTVGRGSFNVHRVVPTAPCWGYLCELNDPVDQVVRRSGTARLRPAPEMIGGFPCLVIEAAGREGRQTLWIDTQRGNNLVKAEVHFTEGDVYNGKPLKKGYRLDATLSQVPLQQINGTWFPAGYTWEYSQLFPDGHFRSHGQSRFSRIEVNPDFDARKAFVPTMIEDGLRVRLAGDNSRRRYTWHKGEILDERRRKVEF